MSIRVTPSASCSTVTSEVLSTVRVADDGRDDTVAQDSDGHVGAARAAQSLHHLADRAPRGGPAVDGDDHVAGDEAGLGSRRVSLHARHDDPGTAGPHPEPDAGVATFEGVLEGGVLARVVVRRPPVTQSLEHSLDCGPLELGAVDRLGGRLLDPVGGGVDDAAPVDELPTTPVTTPAPYDAPTTRTAADVTRMRRVSGDMATSLRATAGPTLVTHSLGRPSGQDSLSG